jgi:hypothetical protein
MAQRDLKHTLHPMPKLSSKPSDSPAFFLSQIQIRRKTGTAICLHLTLKHSHPILLLAIMIKSAKRQRGGSGNGRKR